MKLELFQKLCNQLNFSDAQLISFISHAPVSYKVYTIPKKKGGYRTIAHPSKELKKVQRKLLSLFQKDLQIHESAFAYIKRKNIVQNAQIHKNNKFLLKLDFYSFFNSITSEIFIDYLQKIGFELNEQDKLLVSHIFFWNPNKKDKEHKKLILSVGSPSSPTISNSVMYFFDFELKKYCDSINAKYSRYADDLSISSDNKDDLIKMIKFIREVLNTLFHGKIIINDIKTILISPGNNKFITGITLTPQGNISIGRKRKKYIFGLIYKYIKNELNNESILHLKGLISYSKLVEPLFINRLNKKYTEDIVRRIINE